MNPYEELRIKRYNNNLSDITDKVATERRLRIFSDGKEILNLLCTPTMVKELIVGFALSEGLLTTGQWCPESIEIYWKDEEIEAHLPLSVPVSTPTMTSGCAKGITFSRKDNSISPINTRLRVKTDTLFGLFHNFQARSNLYKLTGGVHSAALSDENTILCFAEDIGRHNAVDKVIGYCFLEGISTQDRILLVSGRLSSEIISKGARAGIPIIVSRTAPTDMAIAIAEKANITIVGFLRGQRLNVYSIPERIL